MKKLLSLVLLAAVCLTFSGCATIFSGSNQSIVFSAPAGTRIYMDGFLLAEVPQGYDAVSTRVGRSLNGMSMVAKKEGYKDAYFYVRSRVNGVVFVNILLGPSMLLGGAIDLITGAAAEYPNYIQIGMEPLEVVDQSAVDNILQY